MNETLNDFVIGNGTNVSAIGIETLAPQTNGHFNNFETIVDGKKSESQNQLMGNNIDNKTRKAVDNAILTVENRMLDAILTAMHNVVIPRVEMAVRSITGSLGQRPSSVVQSPDRRDFTGNTENVPLMSASSLLDLNVDQDRDDETRNVKNF